MKEKRHLEKELSFNTKIKDIVSISLDSEFNIENDVLSGNFIVSGEYKIHELSMNRESFNFKVPFSEELTNNVDKDTLKLEIMDFTYDYKDDELKVIIDYEISGELIDIIEFDDKESLDDFLLNREVDVIDSRMDEIKDNIKEEYKKENDDAREYNINTIDEGEVDTKNVIENISNKQENQVVYKVYKLQNNETLESLVIKYHTTIEDLKEYNDINNLNVGDKIIIPYYE